MKYIITTITVLILLVLSFIISSQITKGISGINENEDINITKGQIGTMSINTGTIITLRGAAQYIAKLGSDSRDIETRFGPLLATSISTPILNSPSNNIYINSTQVTLSWDNSTEDGAQLTYYLEVFNDTNQLLIGYFNSSISETANPTNDTTSPLVDGNYSWRVVANDGTYNSTYSENFTFIIDTTLPSNFTLLSPENKIESADTTPELTWTPSIEINLDNYTVEFCSVEECLNPTIIGTSLTESFSDWKLNESLDVGDHFWRITAIDKTNHQNFSNIFKYTVTGGTVTVSRTSESSGGSGGGGGGSSTRLFTIDVLAPADIVLEPNGVITVPLIIRNPSSLLTLRDINLKTEQEGNIITNIEQTFIRTLRPLEQVSIPLTINSNAEVTGVYAITIIATVGRPAITDKTRIVANLIDQGFAEKTEVSQQLSFVKNLLNGNPECLDLKEFISQAELSLEENKFDQALSLIENTIAGCQTLIKIEKPSLTQPLLEVPYLIEQNKTTFILLAEGLGFLVFIKIMFKIFKKKKHKK